MTTVNYPNPVYVNGYTCRNCTDVDYAKKHIDPQHPKDGPYGIDKTQSSNGAAQPPTRAPGAVADSGRPPAVVFGGQLTPPVPTPNTPTATQGVRLDLKV